MLASGMGDGAPSPSLVVAELAGRLTELAGRDPDTDTLPSSVGALGAGDLTRSGLGAEPLGGLLVMGAGAAAAGGGSAAGVDFISFAISAVVGSWLVVGCSVGGCSVGGWSVGGWSAADGSGVVLARNISLVSLAIASS